MSYHSSPLLAALKPFKSAWLGALTALSLLMCAPAYGLSMVPRSFDELVQRAEVVLVGTVQDVRSEFAGGGLDQNTIFCYVNVTALKVVKARHCGTKCHGDHELADRRYLFPAAG
jgi:hypothetical protein